MEDAILLLNNIRALDERLIGRLAMSMKFQEVAKHEFLLEAGELASDIYIIKSGLLGVCYKDRHETIFTSFRAAGDVIISDKHFFDEFKSDESILALRDSFIYTLPYRKCKQICQDFPEFNHHIRILVQREIKLIEERLKAIQISAWWRYQRFAKDHPDIFGGIPTKYLASYLNTSIRTIQRVRRVLKHREPD
jgi:CRP-like cAMP-binding protein